MSYVPDADGRFAPEYAEVYGVPFQFLPTAGTTSTPTTQKEQYRVHALAGRAHLEQTFPRLAGYRYDLPRTTLTASFDNDSIKTLSTQDLPTRTELEAVVGEGVVTDLDDLKALRLQQVEFALAKRTLDGYLRAADDAPQPWLFPQVLRITKSWLTECVVTKDHTFPQLLLLTEHAHDAAQRIYHSIVRGTAGEARVLPILRSFDPIGTTADVDFTTTKPVYATEKSHVSHLAEDSTWESKVAQVLEDMDEVICYVKNDRLGLRIPYTYGGHSANYLPDILIRVDTGDPEPLNLLVEVTGERRADKQVKVDTARTLWVPAVNAHGGFGRWSFYEVTDPWNAEHDMRAHIESLASGAPRTDRLPMETEVRER